MILWTCVSYHCKSPNLLCCQSRQNLLEAGAQPLWISAFFCKDIYLSIEARLFQRASWEIKRWFEPGILQQTPFQQDYCKGRRQRRSDLLADQTLLNRGLENTDHMLSSDRQCEPDIVQSPQLLSCAQPTLWLLDLVEGKGRLTDQPFSSKGPNLADVLKKP